MDKWTFLLQTPSNNLTYLDTLAFGIQELVLQMRNEQQTIRDWVEAQATKQAEIKSVLEQIANNTPQQPNRKKD